MKKIGLFFAVLVPALYFYDMHMEGRREEQRIRGQIESEHRVDPTFESCLVASALGYGPYVKDFDEEYAAYPDTDGDGLVCED